jgi:hypothetical protein
MDAVLARTDDLPSATELKHVTIGRVRPRRMALKLTAFFVTLLINIVAGGVIFFFLLLAMNGYSESDATWGIGAYIVLAILVSIAMATGALLAVQQLVKRAFRGVISVLIAISVFSIAGAVLKFVCSIIGV